MSVREIELSRTERKAIEDMCLKDLRIDQVGEVVDSALRAFSTDGDADSPSHGILITLEKGPRLDAVVYHSGQRVVNPQKGEEFRTVIYWLPLGEDGCKEPKSMAYAGDVFEQTVQAAGLIIRNQES